MQLFEALRYKAEGRGFLGPTKPLTDISTMDISREREVKAAGA